MSMFDRQETYKIPCPKCGGVVEFWYFSPDCRGNPASSGISCKKCGREFSEEEWKKIEEAAKKKPERKPLMKPKAKKPAKKKKNVNPGIALAIQMANADLEKSGAKRVLEDLAKDKKSAKKKPSMKPKMKKPTMKARGKKCIPYEVCGPVDNRFVRCPIEVKPGRYLTAADVDAILKKEFPGVPRKEILFSIDSCHLYFGNDRIPNNEK